MVRVKICGITNLEDALNAINSGADALGFVFAGQSPRQVSPEQAQSIIRQLPPFVQTVGLFVNETLDKVNQIADTCGLDIIQLHGEETPRFCSAVKRRVIKAIRVKGGESLAALKDYQTPAAFLLDAWSPDAHGGTGLTFNWEIAANAAKSSCIILAGGLTPDNIEAAISKVLPFGVDVSSGVEASPGKKDPLLVQAFIRLAKNSSSITPCS